MKKLLPGLLLTIFLQQAAIAQTNTVTGTVMDKSGNSLRFVFVKDSVYKYGSYTDSLGHFAIKVHPDSKLHFELPGYKDTLISFSKNSTDVQVALSPLGPVSQQLSAGSSSGQSSSEALTRNEVARISNETGGYLMPAHEKGDTRGSQYLFIAFVHGYLINASDELVQRPNYLFDYDKINGNLLLTRDNKTIVSVGWDEAKSFSLFGSDGQRVDFEKVPSVNQSRYVQVLVTGNKYKICKLINTRFAKADYVNNGAAPHGHDYDEYIDEPDYYVVDIQSNQAEKFSPRKKSIKKAFAKEADKVDKFMSADSGRIDDTYLSKLGDYMNN